MTTQTVATESGGKAHLNTNTLPLSIEDEIRRAIPYSWRLGSIKVISSDGELILRGELPTYYLRQRLHAIVQRAVGLTRVHDEIKVVYDSKRESPHHSM
jgi:hypothetical protein